jgi:hypothetical protein
MSSLETKSLPMPAASRRTVLVRLRPLILMGVVSAIIMQIVALSPSSVEEARDTTAPIEPDALVPHEKVTLAPGIPKGQVPEYSVDQFNYVSTHESVKEWNLIAATAYFYNSAGLVHARTVTAYLYDPDGKITIVTGQEAKYTLVTQTAHPKPSPAQASATSSKKAAKAPTDNRDLEVFGDVKTVFPDGFEVHSEYMRYRPDVRTVEIPASYHVTGRGKDESGQILGFKSLGMHYSRQAEQITLPQDVTVTIEKAPNPNTTKIQSDRCVIDRAQKMAFFTMNAARPISERYVRVTQPTLFSKGRRGELNYGDLDSNGSKSSNASKNTLLHKVALYDDVLVKETGKGSLRYATSGQADFDSSRDIVVLTKFPQVYENEDTVVGDRIILHRDTDVVEVEHSNSFSTGQQIR